MSINIRIFSRQLIRSKKRLILNIILLTAATAFFIMSLNLYHNSTTNLQRVEDTYSTIATVTFFGDMNRQGNLTDPEAEDYLGYGTILPRDFDLTPLLNFDYVKGLSRSIRCEAYIPGSTAIATTAKESLHESLIKYDGANPDAVYLNNLDLMLRFTIDSEEPIQVPLTQDKWGRWQPERSGVTLPVKVTASTVKEISFPKNIRLSFYLEEADIRQLNHNEETHQLTLYPGVEYVYSGYHYVYFTKDPETGTLTYDRCYHASGDLSNSGQFTLYEKPPYYLFDSTVGYLRAGNPYYHLEQAEGTDSFFFQRWEDVQSDAAAKAQWETMWKGVEYNSSSFSVTMTDSIASLPAGHLGALYLNEGRLITPEEYASGAKVCMITGQMADLQGWKIGDKLDMHLFSNQEYISGIGTEHLEYPGYNYTTGDFFDVNTYEIVGILGQREILGTSMEAPDPFYLPWNTIYIPTASAPHAPAAELQPLQPCLLSIELENGSLDDYLKALKALGIMEKTEGKYTVEVHCYDQGYSIVQPGLVRMRATAQLLLILSVVVLLTTLVLVAYFFAQHQKVSAGILRMLGGTKQQVFAGILICALLVVLVGAAVGGISGGLLSQTVGERIAEADAARQEALKEFSTDVVNDRNSADSGVSMGADVLISTLGALSIVCGFLTLLGLFVGNYLKIEPRELLAQRR